MVDLATLALKVDSTDVAKGVGELDKLTAAGKKTEGAVAGVGVAAKGAAGGVQTASQAATSAVGSFKMLASAAAGLGLGLIAREIIATNALFQKLDVQLRVATGSASGAAAAMADIKKFAAETPYALEQSVNAFLKLKNLGLDPSTAAMRSYGNTASSMGKDIMQMVEAVADATTGEFERLKEFGIKASKSGELVTFTFHGLTTTVANSGAAIEKYLQAIGNTQFAGAMAAQMDTLNGKWANLLDNLDALYVSIGQLGANSALSAMLGAAAQAVSFLASNLDTIVKYLGAAAIAWGVYTAATVLGAVATSTATGAFGAVAVIVGTVAVEFGVLAAAEVLATAGAAGLAAGFNTLTAAMARNPIGIFAVALAALASALFLSRQRTEELAKAQFDQFRHAEQLDRITAELAKQQGILATATGQSRVEALAHANALRSEAAEALRAAGALAMKARINAFSKAEEARKNAPASLIGSSGYGGSGISIGRSVLAKQAEETALSAEKAFREVTARVAGFSSELKGVQAPIALASAATGKLGAAAKATARELSEEEKALRDLIKAYQDGTIAKNAYAAIGAANIERGGLDEALARNGIGTLDDDLDAIGKAADEAYAKTLQGMEDAQAAADALNNALRDTINLLDGLGGFGQTLGNIGAIILGLQSGDFSGARGPIGSLLGLLNQTAGGKDLIGSLTKVMDKVFGGEGSFAKTMTSVLQGAGVGMAAGQTVLGAKSSNIGAAIGGAAGKAIGTAIAGPVGGAIGSILGGIAGGFIGGLFKKTKTGSASVTNSGTALGGNNADRRGASGSVGGSVQSSLANIVEALGGTGGSYGFTIGMRKDEYRVSGSAGAIVTGKNPSGLIYRGKDAEEAARAALLNAIQDGAITGIRAGAQQLLRAGKDIESGLAKALKFQGVFDELKSKVDPVGFALGNITKEFDKLTAIFKEAGATAAEYADLEKLMGLKREEAMQTARQAVIDNLRDPITLQIRALELLGQQQDAIAGARQLELAGLKSTLRPLQSMVYQLEDARSIIERFGPLADDLRKFRTELVGNGSGTGFAAITAAFRSTAASAALGDADALGNLRGTAKENAGTALDYRRAVGEVLASVDKGIFAADSQVEYAQMQIDAIKNTNDILAQMRAEFAQLQEQVIVNTSTTARIMTRFEGDGITILPSSNTADFIRVRAV